MTEQPLSLEELSDCLSAAPELIQTFVAEGILVSVASAELRFESAALGRARRALRVQRAFDLDVGSLALVLELLDELERVRARAERLEAGFRLPDACS
ncbi:MAG TPA: chaperone modulator CbpM [Acidiferrobacteraceae bacterium]|nr:chaperone modulator CbpM [Acidiferrobacteraceae bacterium]